MSEDRLEALKANIRAFNDERDWGRFHNPRNLAMALSVEASELLELYLWSSDEGPQPAVEAREERVAEELADVFILMLNLADKHGIDLLQAAEEKLKANARKYPVDRVAGRMEKYDEY